MKALEEILWKNNNMEIKKEQENGMLRMNYNCIAICCSGGIRPPKSGGGCR